MRLIALLLLLLTAAADYSPLPPLSAMPAPAASGRVAVGDAGIWYASYGSGPPVILLQADSPTAITGPARSRRSQPRIA